MLVILKMDESKKVSWNASQGLIAEISNRRSYANTFFVMGDIRKAFNTLRAVKQSVIQSLNKPERKELEVIEEKFARYSIALYKTYSNSWNGELNKAYSVSKKLSIKVYSEYNDCLMDILDKYGYLIGEQSDSSKMNF